jgi:hypothetical protein
MPKSHELPGFISDTRAALDSSGAVLPRLEISYINDQGIPSKHSFDMNTKEGRHFQNRFIIWILKNGGTFTGYPAK